MSHCFKRSYGYVSDRYHPGLTPRRTLSDEYIRRRCHLVIDTGVILDSPALYVPRSLVSAHSPVSRRPGDCAPSQGCRAPRQQTVELPLSDDPVQVLILQWDSSLNLTAPEGAGALGLLL